MASARAARAPKPLEAPVMTITFFMSILLLSLLDLRERKDCVAREVCGLCEATVCAKHLRVDPSAIGAGEEGNNARDIVRLTDLRGEVVLDRSRPHGR